ncbi:transcriptional regulator BetI [Sphingomonas sp. LaA6.9]|uniref:transcriptional regulator BetI n=1 Tax=Sphingomonas sp. LaA6.9 TaxID=2919914 RepID=UPI001F4FDC5B|nr:transcriptional regulator BetI [Sphingomonas sp. LaA6.9]MCJ8156412.1 transcriptional regulator BetI [Sphingomonas sp. LaA6.9]
MLNQTRASFTREPADARRQALIDATAACLAQRGVPGTSVRTICARAGVSPGLLRHYFAGVDALIAETYREVTGRVADTFAAAVAGAGDNPRARLIAYVTASFRPPITDPSLLATWLAFWSLVKTDVAIAAIHGETYRAYRSDLEDMLIACGMTAVEAGPVAIALTALVDGLWLELSLDPTTFTAEQASAMVVRWLDTLLERPAFG